MAGFESVKNSIRHKVYTLSKIFGVDVASDANIYTYAEKLEQSIGIPSDSQFNIRDSVSKICERSPKSEIFLRKYEELKLRNIKELSGIVYLLSKLKSEPGLLRTLKLVAHQKTSPLHNIQAKSTNASISIKDVDKLRQMIADSSSLVTNSMQLDNKDGLKTAIGSTDELSLSSTPGPSTPQSLFIPSSRNMTKKLVCTSRTQKSAESFMQPEWLYSRPTLWKDFLPTSLNSDSFQQIPIESLSNAVQEYAVVNDLLQCLQGNQGVYIKPLPLPNRYAVRTFKVDEKMTPTLLDTVNKILPICSDYSTVTRFIDEKSAYEYGMVNQGLAGAMDDLLKDYLILICELEYLYKVGELGIVKLHFLLQEAAITFNQLARVATDVNTGQCCGGAVLSVLYDSMRSVYGVKKLHAMMLYLLHFACMPFFKILRKWIYRGVISDPYKEFFISDGAMHKLSHNDKSFSSNIFSSPFQSDRFTQSYVDWAFFWECHYTIVPTNLPCFLEHSASKILNTGKYLNVVQKCADDYELPACEELAYNQEHTIFLEKIDQAHLYASSLLLNLVLKKKDLKEHLKSVKRFFLLDQGDFIVHFLDAAASELCKRSEVVSQLRLSSLLESALRTSTANADRFKDNLAVVIFQFDLISQILMVLRAGSESKPDSPLPIEDKNLSGLEAFCLDYRVGWPIDLVLNRQVMDRYQMLFRHLLYCKHVERLLCKSWILVKLARKSDNLMTTWFTTAFLLTQRMLSFVQHFQYYMSVEIIEPAWHTFFKRLDKVSNLDVLLDSHLHFLEVCMDDCLLTSPELLSLVGKLLVACVTFANFIQHFAISISGINLSSSGVSDYGSIHSLRYSDAERPFLHDPTPSTALERPANKMKCARPQSSMSSAESIAAKVTREEFDRMSLSSDSAQIVSSVDAAFNRMLVLLLERIKLMAKHQSKLLSLVSRIDFNEFYTEYAIQLRRKDSVGLARNQGPSIDDGTLFEHRSTPPANTTHDIEDYI